jgi:ADP-L-glycero-D-manno-heptose 6-epimerase
LSAARPTICGTLCFRASVSSSAATYSDGVNGFVDDNEPAVQRLRPLRFDEAKAARPIGLFKSRRSGVADGDQQRDLIYVDDTIEVMLWLLSHHEVSGLFNLETGQARSFRDLVTAMFAALGPAPHIQYADMPHSFRNTYQYFPQAPPMQRLRHAECNLSSTRLEDAVRNHVISYLDAANRYR